MSSDQNGNSMGDQITGALSKALQTGDFADLNGLVSQTVTDALNDAGKHIAQSISNTSNIKHTTTDSSAKDHGSARQTQEQELNQQRQQKYQEQLKRQQRQQRKQQEELQRQQRQLQKQREQLQKQQRQLQKQQNQYQIQPEKQAAAAPAVKFREIGSISNVLYQVFGGIGLGISSLLAIVRLPGIFLGTASIAGWVMNIVFFIVFLCMIRFGVGQRDRLARARRYIQLCGGRMYVQIESLALNTGSSIRYVAKDIQKMLRLGMFPEGHLDEQKTCFMLDDAVHRQYLEARDSHRLRETAEIEASQSKEHTAGDDASEPSGGDREAELNTMIAEGMECIRKLRELNDKIPGEVISGKLYRLENLLKDIFNSVREHPEQMRRMHKLMDYYLPTTLKLVEAYEDFDKVSMPGEEIIAAKSEIERTLDIINEAFAELLSNLFQDAVFDATTDAQVLQTMLAKEGLTKDTEFKNIISGGTPNE